MIATIKHQDSGPLIVVAKLLTEYLRIDKKVSDPDSYIKANGLFDAGFVAHVCAWQGNHKLTPDGVIGPATWTAIANTAPTCSTAKNRISGPTMACQILLGGNLKADAIYGANTKAAVAVLQDAHGLKTDGICGPRTWSALIVGEGEKPQPAPDGFVQPVDYKQADKPWGPRMYSNHGDKSQTMANSGCGPTAAADVVATLKDSNINPYDLAELSMQWGDRSYSSGTNWSFFKHIAEHFRFAKFVQTKSMDALKACLDAGGYVVCSMGKGYWTNGGHYICAWKYTATDIYCNDPASTKRTHQNTKDFISQSKQFFCYYPDAKPNNETPTQGTKRGEKIVDISKYQPNVNYDALISDTALIILRAGYRGTSGDIKKDQVFDNHANELIKRGVRFGVYFYSIANNAEKAQIEARMFYSYAKQYNPLFWAMDAEKDVITNAAIVAFTDELRKLGAARIGVYCANHLYNKYDYDSIANKMDFTWIPDYRKNTTVRKCDLWQFTSTGTVAGIAGNVDLNKITGDGKTLEWFCGGVVCE